MGKQIIARSEVGKVMGVMSILTDFSHCVIEFYDL